MSVMVRVGIWYCDRCARRVLHQWLRRGVWRCTGCGDEAHGENR